MDWLRMWLGQTPPPPKKKSKKAKVPGVRRVCQCLLCRLMDFEQTSDLRVVLSNLNWVHSSEANFLQQASK